MNELPLPDYETPWQAIYDWREDSDAREQYRRLRAWIGRAAREQVNAPDIGEELASMLSTYERYMALRHKKIVRGRLEAILVVVAELVEDIAHFRLSSAVNRFFSFRRDEILLLESEIAAPGHEVAYIASTRARFR